MLKLTLRATSAASVLLLAIAGPAAAAGAAHTVVSGESLTSIAADAWDRGRAWPAIMLATNSRLSRMPELSFIGDPNALEPGQIVFVPDADERDDWSARYRVYIAAVLDMSLPQPWEISRNLVALPLDDPVKVVTWARDGQFEVGRTMAGRQVWVTAAPHIRDFCRAIPDRDRVVARLEQRLGLPPASNKTVFVEILVEDPGTDLFRPCADPRIDTTTCPLGPPPDDAPDDHRDWFLSQYFASYAQAHPTRFPWTSLGYTFDWGDLRSEEGESEYVVRPEATIVVESIVPTQEYCAPAK